MRDNDLARLFIPIISAGLIESGYNGVKIIQGNQPTQQGIETGPAVYYYKVSDQLYGFPHRGNVWDNDAKILRHSESQVYQTMFQINSLVTQDPMVEYSYTASDLVNEVALIMQSDTTISTLRESDVGILKVSDVRNPYFSDDRDQFEAIPSFDFILTYKRTRLSAVPVIDSFDVGIYPV